MVDKDQRESLIFLLASGRIRRLRAKDKGAIPMQKKLTLTIDEDVYEGLRRVIGQRRISRFIEELVRPHVLKKDLYDAYRQMGADSAREAEALDWAEATCGDVSDEKR